MKTKTTAILLALLVVLTAAAIAENFDVELDPATAWSDGFNIYASYCATFRILIDNPSPYDRNGMSIPLTFYMTGDGTSWKMLSYEAINGFEEGSPWWDFYNSFWTRGGDAWDGNIADTINWSGSGLYGFPSGEPMMPRFQYDVRFPLSAITGESYFCIDSCSIPNVNPPGKYDWIFATPSPSFGGPYCFQVKMPPCYYCSDVNGDFEINILDAVYLINYLYNDGPGWQGCFPDIDGTNCAVNILDVVYLINYLYNGGPEPQC